MYKVAAVVLNYMTFRDTVNAVDLLLLQEKCELSIVIVDNCSPNCSYEFLHENYLSNSNVFVIKSDSNGGYARGNNIGLNFLRNKDIDFIFICNNDIELDSTELFYAMISRSTLLDRCAFVSPVMHTADGPCDLPAWRLPSLRDDIVGSLRLFEFLFNSKRSYNINRDDISMEVDCVPGSFFMVKKEVFIELGFFDENTFLYNEESILAFKAKEYGLKNYLLLDLSYYHSTSKTISLYHNIFATRRYLLRSRIYYHSNYLRSNFVGILVLKVLYFFWKIETIIINVLRPKAKIIINTDIQIERNVDK